MNRLRRYAPLVAALAILGGCQANQADNPPPPLENVSLFGVRIGMTPGELNVMFPGAHCSPTTEHPSCQVPSTAMGSSGINVTFSNGRVTWAYTEGEMSGGISNVSRLIAEQLGPSQERSFDGSYATTWTAKDESELALFQGHNITASNANSYPAEYTLSLSSPASRKRHAQELDTAQQKIERDLTNTLGQIFAVDPAGRVSVCGVRIGATFDGNLGCPASARAELFASSRFGNCGTMLGPHLSDPLTAKHGAAFETPTAKVCVSVTADAATRQVTGISATFARDATEWSTIHRALMTLPNASRLEPSQDDLIFGPARHYENTLGDVVTFKMDEDQFAFDKPLGQSKKLLTVSIAGKTAQPSFK